jgi:hypothetical protein
MKTNDINIAPVKKYTPPKYPTIISAKNDPNLLQKLPSRWEKNASVVVALGLIGTMTLTSCGLLGSPNNASPTLDEFKDFVSVIIDNGKRTSHENNYLNVAPVFIHGEGIGSMGCMMIAPPVFLSEQEALAIIKGVAEDAGLNFGDHPPKYIATQNKGKIESYGWESGYILGNGNIGLDLYDSQNQVAVTYISMTEAKEKYLPYKINDNEEMFMESSVTSYRPRELAGLVVEDFSQQIGDIAVGVFYDPGINWQSEEHQRILNEYYKNTGDYENDTKKIIEDQFRAQVQDFIEWLQGQGII